MKLVTFDEGRVGHVEGDEIAVLDVPTMREYFERGGADETGERVPLEDARLRRADRAEEVLPHGRQLPRARGGVEAGRLDARDRAVDRLLPERRRDRRAGRAGRLPGAPDRGARLRARARGRDPQRRGSGSRRTRRRDYIGGYVIFNDITARDIQRREMRSGVFSLLQGDRHVLPARAVDRDAATRSPTRTTCGWSCASTASRGRTRTRATCRVTIPEILSHYSALGYSAGDVVSTGTVSGVAGLLGGRRVALPEAGRRDGVRDRADRRAAQPGRVVAGGARRAGAAAGPLVRRGPLLRLLDRLRRRRPGVPEAPPPEPPPPDAGVREPRRPKPSGGSGTAVVEPPPTEEERP